MTIDSTQQKSRRALLTGAAAGAAVLAAGQLARPLAATRAADGEPVLLGQYQDSTSVTSIQGGGFRIEGGQLPTSLIAHGVNDGAEFLASSVHEAVVTPESTLGAGDAIHGETGSGIGVQGKSAIGTGVWGASAWANGVRGDTRGLGGAGVHGRSLDGDSEALGTVPGVLGESGTGPGVVGQGSPGVAGETRGEAGQWRKGVEGRGYLNGDGIYGASYDGETPGAAPGSGIGVQGNSGSSFGVLGRSDTHVGVCGEVHGTMPAVLGHGFNSAPGVVGRSLADDTFEAGGGTGVTGESGTGDGVLGRSESGTGVHAMSEAGAALDVSGRAVFSGAGRALVAAGSDHVAVASPVPVSDASVILVTLLGNPKGTGKKAVAVYFSHVEITGTDGFDIVLTGPAGRDVSASYLVVEMPTG